MFKILDRIEAMLKTVSSPMRIIAAFSEIERELGIVGLSDFHFVSPTAFAAPNPGPARAYGREHFERLCRCVPSFQHLADRFYRLGTNKTTYVAAATNFGGEIEIHHGKGTCTFRSSDLAAAFGGEKTPSDSGAEIIRLAPGTYDRGAVVVALSPHLAERHLQWQDKDSLRVHFVDSEVTLPLSCLVGVVQRSSGREAMLVEQVLRAYWQRLQGQYGYRARCEGPYWLCEGRHGHDPEGGALPEELVKVQKVGSDLPDVVELRTAKSLLECWVRLAKIVKLIEQHQEKHPLHAVA